MNNIYCRYNERVQMANYLIGCIADIFIQYIVFKGLSHHHVVFINFLIN